MPESNSFKFSCPNCGQHLEETADMAGLIVDCPNCGQSLVVPANEEGLSEAVDPDAKGDSNYPERNVVVVHPQLPTITVIKGREGFIDRCKRHVKAIGIGIALLCLFVGVGIIAQISNDNGDASVPVEVQRENRNGRTESLRPTVSAKKEVLASVECLLDFLKLPNERRLQVLSNSLDAGPRDFKDAVSEYLVSVVKNPDDMISTGEKEEAMKAKAGAAILFGILGAASTGDSQRGVNAGLELGDMAYAELQDKARRRLRDEIERKRNRLVEVAQKYGINSNAFEEALVSRER